MHYNRGDEGQFRFWHFPPFLWTEMAFVTSEYSIKSLFWLEKWPRTQKQAEFGQKGDQFRWAGIDLGVSQKNVRLGYLKLTPCIRIGGDEGQFSFWHFSPFLWAGIASAIPECSIKSLFWLVKRPWTQNRLNLAKKERPISLGSERPRSVSKKCSVRLP